ncbi:hypothetical protein EDB83DRAFT_2526639 [Lactarius deliciosus]|nr:hypothetical protein EDB83DRAFT_2526639 [Lactarius deliciosus]
MARYMRYCRRRAAQIYIANALQNQLKANNGSGGAGPPNAPQYPPRVHSPSAIPHYIPPPDVHLPRLVKIRHARMSDDPRRWHFAVRSLSQLHDSDPQCPHPACHVSLASLSPLLTMCKAHSRAKPARGSSSTQTTQPGVRGRDFSGAWLAGSTEHVGVGVVRNRKAQKYLNPPPCYDLSGSSGTRCFSIDSTCASL